MKLPTLVLFLACAAMAAAEEPPRTSAPTQLLAYAFIPDISDYYPATARASGEQGTAYLVLCYDQSGKPVDVTVAKSSGFTRIDEAAIRWGKAVRIKPAISHGVARQGCVWVPAKFSLEKSPQPPDKGDGMLPDALPNPPMIWPQIPPPPPPVGPIPLAPPAPVRPQPLGSKTDERFER